MTLTKIIHNVDTGEITEIELTAKELEENEKTEKDLAKISAEQKKKAEAKSALLEKLGITEEEAKLLLS